MRADIEKAIKKLEEAMKEGKTLDVLAPEWQHMTEEDRQALTERWKAEVEKRRNPSTGV